MPKADPAFQDLLADYDRVIELNPWDAVAYNNRGNAYNDMQEYAAALADATQQEVTHGP